MKTLQFVIITFQLYFVQKEASISEDLKDKIVVVTGRYLLIFYSLNSLYH
jgi:hypothetical protein